MVTNISEEHSAFVFRQKQFSCCTLKKGAVTIFSFKMVVTVSQQALCQSPPD
jgi:hypothetical protein